MMQKVIRKTLAASALLATLLLSACGGITDNTAPKAVSTAIRPQLTSTQAANYSYASVLRTTGTAGSETDDPWDPLADAFMTGDSPVTPNYTVDASITANTSSTFKTVLAAISQAANDAAMAASTERIYIKVLPGTYNELVYIPASTAPITLYGADPDARKTVIQATIDQGLTGASYDTTFGAPFNVPDMNASIASVYTTLKARTTLGTSNSAVVMIKNTGFQAKNISFINTYNEDRADAASNCADGKCGTANAAGQLATGNHQAVAVLIDGADKVQFENVRFIGNQDTLYFRSPTAGTTVRSFHNRSYVEGDVDFIFGRSTAYFNRSEIKSLGVRTTRSYATAPSTNYNTKFGIVFNDCDFTNDGTANTTTGTFNLARQWFEGVKCTPYGTSNVANYVCAVGTTDAYTAPNGTISKLVLETVGKTIVLNSRIGAHINKKAPWAEWNNGTFAADGTYTPNAKWSTSTRPVQFDSDDFYINLGALVSNPYLNYTKKIPPDPFLSEYNNTGAGSAP